MRNLKRVGAVIGIVLALSACGTSVSRELEKQNKQTKEQVRIAQCYQAFVVHDQTPEQYDACISP